MSRRLFCPQPALSAKPQSSGWRLCFVQGDASAQRSYVPRYLSSGHRNGNDRLVVPHRVDGTAIDRAGSVLTTAVAGAMPSRYGAMTDDSVTRARQDRRSATAISIIEVDGDLAVRIGHKLIRLNLKYKTRRIPVCPCDRQLRPSHGRCFEHCAPLPGPDRAGQQPTAAVAITAAWKTGVRHRIKLADVAIKAVERKAKLYTERPSARYQ